MQTMAQAWIEEGRVEGVIEGEQKGGAAITLKILRKQFTDLDDASVQMVERLPLAQLEAFVDIALDFQTVDEVHEWLRQNAVRN